MKRWIPALAIMFATAAIAAPIQGGVSCSTDTVTSTLSVVNVTFTRDANGIITGGSAVGFCPLPTTPVTEILSFVKDGVICTCPKQSGTGKDLWCKAMSSGEDQTTWSSCTKSGKP